MLHARTTGNGGGEKMNKKIAIFPIVAILVLSSVLISSMGGNTLQAQNGEMHGAMSFAPDSQAPVTLNTFKHYSGDKYSYVTAGIGVRNTGRGTISLRLPLGTTLVDAWLYWMILDATTPFIGNVAIDINGIRVVGTLIGSGTSPCWPPPKGYTYRASVTSMLTVAEGTSAISYGLEVGGMTSSLTTGVSPWAVAAPVPMAEYVGLILVYKDPTLPGPSVVHILDGYYEQGGGAATFAYAWPARAAGTSARFSHLVGDGQEVGITPYTKAVDITVGAVTTILDHAHALNGNDPSITSKATNQGSLADTDTYNVGPLVPLAGGATTITWTMANDCLSWAALVFGTGVDAP